MEHVSDKLKVLDCQTRFCKARDQPPLQRWCFAIPARNPSIQFMLFLDLCSWLMSEITGEGAASGFQRASFGGTNLSASRSILMQMGSRRAPT